MKYNIKIYYLLSLYYNKTTEFNNENIIRIY